MRVLVGSRPHPMREWRVDGQRGRALTLVEVTVLRTPTDAEVGRRPQSIADALADSIERTGPDVVAGACVQPTQCSHGHGHCPVAGIAIVALSGRASGRAARTPSEVKAAITGSESPARLR